MKTKNEDYEKNLECTTFAVFMKSYNGTFPERFPRATEAKPRAFQKAQPRLFKDGNLWSLVKHRKKLMDWMPSSIWVMKGKVDKY